MHGILRTLALFVSAATFSSVLASPSWSSHDFESVFAPQRSYVEPRSPVKHSVFPKDRVHESAHPVPKEPGTIEVHTKERALYFIDDNGRAVRYRVGVG